jgi:hypothetical protein
LGIQYLSQAVFLILGIASLTVSITLASFLVQKQSDSTRSELALLDAAAQRIRKASPKDWPMLLHDRDALTAGKKNLSDALTATSGIWPDEDMVRNTTHLGVEDRRKLAEASLALVAAIDGAVDSSPVSLLKHPAIGVEPVTAPSADYSRELDSLKGYYLEIGRGWTTAHAAAEKMSSLFPEMAGQIADADARRAELLRGLSGYWGTYWVAALLDPKANQPSARTLVTMRPGIKGRELYLPLSNLAGWAKMQFRDARRLAQEGQVCAGWSPKYVSDRYPQRFALSCFVPGVKEGDPPEVASIRLDYQGAHSEEVLDSKGDFQYRRWLNIFGDEIPRTVEYRFRTNGDRAAMISQLGDAFEAELAGSAQVTRGKPLDPMRFVLRPPQAGQEESRCEVIMLGPPFATTMGSGGHAERYPITTKDCRFRE